MAELTLQRPTFGARFARRANNFDLLRLFGALLVLVSHAWVLTGEPDAEPFAILLGRYTDGGGLAVAMFFVLSGFLIARSAASSPVAAYVRSRALRIYPALVVVLVLQTVVLGPAMTGLPIAAYLRDPSTWSALLRGLLFSPPLGLPGLFAANPVPAAVNGSLWTLRIEALCYAGVLLLALMHLLRPRRIGLVIAAAAALLGVTMLARTGALPPALASLKMVSIVDCLVHFAAGAVLWVLRDRVPHRTAWAVAGTLLLVAGAGTWAAPALFHLVLPYLVLWLGLTQPVGQTLLRRTGDLSYGIYLYAFPIQQTIVALAGPAIGPLGLIALALPPTLLCAALSRTLVELPALRLKRRPRRLPA